MREEDLMQSPVVDDLWVLEMPATCRFAARLALSYELFPPDIRIRPTLGRHNDTLTA